ncbi:MAG: hypothetical protein M1823_003851 [Watsoniomyces obsoletus]|nr:MAG: hypothetical protein M1823_003851 [Watsoniomyces obsoletus]
MICSRCLHRAHARLLPSDFRSTYIPSFPLPLSKWQRDRRQQFSIQTPLHDPAVTESPSPQTTGGTATAPAPARPKPAKAIKSLVPAGAPLRGLNFLKDRNDPVALPDAEYPEWLWTCIDSTAGKKSKSGGGDGGGATAGQSTKKTKGGKGASKLAASLNMESARQAVPLAEQTVDLPSNPQQDLEGAIQATIARDELTKALRVKRRGNIKEANFLKGMN